MFFCFKKTTRHSLLGLSVAFCKSANEIDCFVSMINLFVSVINV